MEKKKGLTKISIQQQILNLEEALFYKIIFKQDLTFFHQLHEQLQDPDFRTKDEQLIDLSLVSVYTLCVVINILPSLDTGFEQQTVLELTVLLLVSVPALYMLHQLYLQVIQIPKFDWLYTQICEQLSQEKVRVYKDIIEFWECEDATLEQEN